MEDINSHKYYNEPHNHNHDDSNKNTQNLKVNNQDNQNLFTEKITQLEQELREVQQKMSRTQEVITRNNQDIDDLTNANQICVKDLDASEKKKQI